MRRLPADAARLRGRAAAARRRARHRLLPRGRADRVEGSYDLSIVEGSITTPEDAARIREIRARSGHLITIGACAVAGGIQALRNFADVEDFMAVVYASPEYVSTLATSTPASAHVAGRLRAAGLPARQAPAARGHRRLPQRAPARDRRAQRLHRVQAGRQRVRDGRPRHALPRARSRTPAAAALCPSYHRGCYGCFGPAEAPNPRCARPPPRARASATSSALFRTFYAGAPAFGAPHG